jgi:tetratricopeptide (TPR) repeat protein
MHRSPCPSLCPRLSLLFLCLLAACGEGSRNASTAVVPAREGPPAQAVAAPAATRAAPAEYRQEVAAIDSAIANSMRFIDQQRDDTLVTLETGALHVERARLTGNYDDYAKAAELLATATARSHAASFPCLALAKIHYALHRLHAATAALEACPGSVDPAEIGGLSADIAFYSGRYREAEGIYRDLVNQVGTPRQYIRLALLKNKMGSPGEAAALLEAAEARYHGPSATMKAWLKLQRGLIAWDRGRLDEAVALYSLAADELAGWWLVDEHVAEAKRLAGDSAGARTIYESIIRRSGQPEHMDALAQLLRESETPEAATEWIKRADAIYRERLKSFPEASVGHAVDHFLRFGQPTEALALARRNVELRPYGDAQIALAAALFRAGQAGAAAELIARVEASGWNTAELHAVAAQINAGLGRHAEADAQRARAVAMNPYAMRLHPLVQPAPSAGVSVR